MPKPVTIRVPVKVKLDVKTTATTSGGGGQRKKKRELDPDKAAGFAKKEALRKLNKRSRTFGERF
jgi:hypothetical protein